VGLLPLEKVNLLGIDQGDLVRCHLTGGGVASPRAMAIGVQYVLPSLYLDEWVIAEEKNDGRCRQGWLRRGDRGADQVTRRAIAIKPTLSELMADPRAWYPRDDSDLTGPPITEEQYTARIRRIRRKRTRVLRATPIRMEEELCPTAPDA
jgi:hypothetical protein